MNNKPDETPKQIESCLKQLSAAAWEILPAQYSHVIIVIRRHDLACGIDAGIPKEQLPGALMVALMKGEASLWFILSCWSHFTWWKIKRWFSNLA